MKKFNTSPISGAQEFLPSTQAVFSQLKSQIAQVYHAHGFQEIETPTIERTEILLAKAGGDTEKQIYKVVKTAETSDEADQALRFDHTVPLARYVVEHENDLPFPFKVTQIGRNFRGERAQKGRSREFYQCDVDIVGRNSLPLAYDAEAIATVYEALTTFVNAKMVVRISNRKILTGLLQALALSEKAEAIFGIIDHAEKVPASVTQEALKNLGLDDSQQQTLTDFISIHGTADEISEKLQSLNITNETYQQGVDELIQILTILSENGLAGNIIGDMLIIRGLDYYTGTVFETILPDYKEIGSICSGGRYDNLASNYTDQSFPGVGGSIGLSRLFYILQEKSLIKPEILQSHQLIDMAIIPISEHERKFAFDTAKKLRAEGKAVDVILTDKKLGDKLAYASKIASAAIVLGENEVTSGTYEIKEFN
ncbi:histidine--tRNA ligase [Candidatus Saccharibacteria bacterium]|nr:histidine--tRNA ligase [Candidatus Saccharibacteria bacterium]